LYILAWERSLVLLLGKLNRAQTTPNTKPMNTPLFGSINHGFFDSYWVIVHFAAGILTGLVILYYQKLKRKKLATSSYLLLGLTVITAWEYFEVVLRFAEKHDFRYLALLHTIIPNGFFAIESTINIISDLVVGGVGLTLAYLFWRQGGRRRKRA
jgi:hypothetical protein